MLGGQNINCEDPPQDVYAVLSLVDYNLYFEARSRIYGVL